MDPGQYGTAFAIALTLALLLTPAARALALRTGALSYPVARSVHTRPLPYLGGLAIYGSLAGALLLTAGWGQETVRATVLVGGCVVALGLVDDLRGLRPSAKLAGQIAAALAAVAVGIRIEWVTNPFGGLLHLGSWGIPITMLWIVALMNVMNLIDGLDGLAAGIAGIASITLLFIALRTGVPTVAVPLAAALAGSSLGFLPFNFNPARLIMGDAGSMLLGFTLAVISVEGTLKGPTAIALVVPVLALGLPIADTVLAMIRRVREGRSIAEADRSHLHHRLLQMGLSHRDAVLVMYFISGWLGISALAVSHMDVGQAALVVTFIVSTAYFGARRLGVLVDQPGREARRRPPMN